MFEYSSTTVGCVSSDATSVLPAASRDQNARAESPSVCAVPRKLTVGSPSTVTPATMIG